MQRTSRWLLSFLAFFLVPLPAWTQGLPEPGVPQELLDRRLRRGGDSIRFCLNGASTLIEFDRAVAQELAAALLVTPDFHVIDPKSRSFPYDFRLDRNASELFLEMTNNCQILMGFPLSRSSILDWLTVTRPYYETQFVLAVSDPELTSFSDLSEDARIGTRLGGSGDIALASYLGVLGGGAPRRIPYPDNQVLTAKLLDHEVDAILVWNAALYRATDGDPEARGVRMIESPVEVPPLNFGMAIAAGDLHLRTLLDQAIAAVAEDGILEQLAREQGLP